jgi:hypothetical protein
MRYIEAFQQLEMLLSESLALLWFALDQVLPALYGENNTD